MRPQILHRGAADQPAGLCVQGCRALRAQAKGGALARVPAATSMYAPAAPVCTVARVPQRQLLLRCGGPKVWPGTMSWALRNPPCASHSAPLPCGVQGSKQHVSAMQESPP